MNVNFLLPAPLRRLFRLAPPRPMARLPDGERIYAIGDVHGRRDLLERLLEAIAADACEQPLASMRVVTLGDAIDRGSHSRGVLDLLVLPPLPPELPLTALRGNHEQMMLDALGESAQLPFWLSSGGDATVVSYGVEPIIGSQSPQRVERVAAALAEAVPPSHRRFLDAMPTRLAAGDYLFVHAGIRPGVALAQQRDDDLMWIRGPFLDSARDHGAVVVHGHHITKTPEARANRIGIDTGAYCGGPLTCLVLEADTRRLIQAELSGIRKSALPPQ
jgi:serine/threonine protein phosphatase 1